MKKRILFIIGVTALIGAVKFSANIAPCRNSLSNLSLANIEALSQSEGSGDKIDCWDTLNNDGASAQTHKTYCTECKAKLTRKWHDASTCPN